MEIFLGLKSRADDMRARFWARFHWQMMYVVRTGQQLCIKPTGFLVTILIFFRMLSLKLMMIWCYSYTWSRLQRVSFQEAVAHNE